MPGTVTHCYHGWFCAGGGASGKIPDAKPPHALGGVKAEVQLREHQAGRAAYIAEHGKEAYQQRAQQLTTRAKNGAAKLSTEDRTALTSERDHLVQQLADGKGGKEEQAKTRAEAVMLTSHLGRNQPKAGARTAGTPKASKAGGPRKSGGTKAHGAGHAQGNGKAAGAGHAPNGAHHVEKAAGLGELLKMFLEQFSELHGSAGSGGSMGGGTSRAATAEALRARMAAMKGRIAEAG